MVEHIGEHSPLLKIFNCVVYFFTICETIVWFSVLCYRTLYNWRTWAKGNTRGLFLLRPVSHQGKCECLFQRKFWYNSSTCFSSINVMGSFTIFLFIQVVTRFIKHFVRIFWRSLDLQENCVSMEDLVDQNNCWSICLYSKMFIVSLYYTPSAIEVILVGNVFRWSSLRKEFHFFISWQTCVPLLEVLCFSSLALVFSRASLRTIRMSCRIPEVWEEFE